MFNYGAGRANPMDKVKFHTKEVFQKRKNMKMLPLKLYLFFCKFLKTIFFSHIRQVDEVSRRTQYMSIDMTDKVHVYSICSLLYCRLISIYY